MVIEENLEKEILKNYGKATLEKYKEFLKYVEDNTKECAESCEPKGEPLDINYDVVGLDFRKEEIIKMFGEDVYKIANSEVPGTEVEGKNLLARDFSSASKKI